MKPEFPKYYVSEISTENCFDVIIILSDSSFRKYTMNLLPGDIFTSVVTTMTHESEIVAKVVNDEPYDYRRWRKVKLHEFIKFMKCFSKHDLITNRKFPFSSH